MTAHPNIRRRQGDSSPANPRSHVGRVTPTSTPVQDARHHGWRYPHRSRREIAGQVLWWLVVAVGITLSVVVAKRV